MPSSFSKYQGRVFSALCSTRSPEEVFRQSPSWCFVCDLEVQSASCVFSRNGVLCPYCRQQTLVPLTKYLPRMRDSLREFSDWLFEELPPPAPAPIVREGVIHKPQMTPKRMLQDELSKTGISIRRPSSKRDRLVLGEHYLYRKSTGEVVQTFFDFKSAIRPYQS